MMSSGDLNPHLVHEIAELEPGTALDAGCGAGAEAIWLAAKGWDVNGADVADTALDYAGDRAAAAGLAGRIASWVAPGGNLLIVGHLHHSRDGRHHRSSRSRHLDGRHG